MKIKKFEFNLFPVNTYLLWNENNEALIIDPGCWNNKEKETLTTYLDTHDLDLKMLLNTHLHLDHILGNPYVCKQYNLKPYAHLGDEFWLENAPHQSRMFGVESPEPQVPIGYPVEDGDILVLGNVSLEAIHVPGHSPGSICYYSAKDRCLFGGDVLFQGSIGRADLRGGNFEELREGICKRLFTLPDETVVYPGHGAPTTIGVEKRENPFFR